jgi:type VI protein secretion system component Hcp
MLNNLGRPVAESVGSQWHLAGTINLVRRMHPSWYASNSSPNCLQLTRRRDGRSWSLEHAMSIGKVLPKLEITTPEGNVTLLNAKIAGMGTAASHGGSKHTGSNDTHELERVSFTFQKIDISNNNSGAAFDDDWSSYPP